ncbi:Hypothetical Protein XCAW_01638 [Xanthomonas citri subsp. citri Aw12879]|nr:Hypothetical Protein XCAW_01638 [Xanthomonas citri subsp. citri Aw12879]
MGYPTVWRMKHKLMQAMAEREAGRGSESKRPFVIAVETTQDGRPRQAVIAAPSLQRGGPAAERHRMRVEQCPRLRANVDAEFLRGRGDTQHFYQLLLSLVAKGAARIPCSPHECR